MELLFLVALIGGIFLTLEVLKVYEKVEYQKILLRLSKKEGQLLAARQAAHDIRSPLTVLSLMVSEQNVHQDQTRELIRNAIYRIRDIANDLLHKDDLEDEEPIPFKQNLSPQQLSKLVEQIVEEKRIQIKGRENKLIRYVAGNDVESLFARVNPSDFKRVLSNLINNSLEATRSNEGVISIGLMGCSGSIRLTVSDNGMGIAHSLLKQLQQQGGSFGKSGEAGFGLGLSHARQMVAQWSGTVQVESQENVGTKITILLPTHPVSVQSAPSISRIGAYT